MKTILLTLCLLLAQLVNGQDTLIANRLKILKGDAYHIVNKNTNPVTIVAYDDKFLIGKDPVIAISVTSIKLANGGKKTTYYLFNTYFIKAVAYYDKHGEIIKFGLLDLEGMWFMFYSATFNV